MNRILVVTLVWAAMVLTTGCKSLSLRSRSDKEQPQTAEQKQIKTLQDELATLKDQLDIRDSQEKELRKRADELAEKVRDLEFINQQQAAQIKVLSQAPLARDEYKALAEQFKTSLERVTTRLADLEATNKLLTFHLKRTLGDKAPSIVLSATAPATVSPTTKPVIILPTTKPATDLPTTAPAPIVPMPPPATVVPMSGALSDEPAPGEEF
jgi:hypothetical protein